MEKQFVSIEDKNPRIFKNKFLESLSKTHWSAPLYVFIPVILICAYISIYVFPIAANILILMIVLGLIIWTFSEYFLHRFLFHYKPKSKSGKRLIFLFHGVHHDYPNDTKRLVMPPAVSIILAAIHFLIFYLILGNLVYSFFIGFIAGYLFYDITHYALHHFPMKNKFFLFLKKHHLRHHFQDHDKGFGVSQNIWDRVFKTNFPKYEKEKLS